jgi:hypothetical protein
MDLSGQRFGNWQVVGPHIREPHKTMWACRCDCGTERRVNAADLRNGKSTNCGCIRRQKVGASNYKHGMGRTRLHARWLGMIARCEDPKHKGWKNYGGRGIRVCQRWRESFVAFLEDMGQPPTQGHKIDRIDNDADYEPANCRWTTNRENCRNGRHNRFLEHNGLRLTLKEWEERTGIGYYTIAMRIDHYGWTVAKALTTPVRSHKPRTRYVRKTTPS